MEILDFDSKTGEYFFIMKIIIYQEAHILEKIEIKMPGSGSQIKTTLTVNILEQPR